MAGGWNTATSGTPGKVTVAGLGGKLSSNWTVTAQGATNMTISGGSTSLTNPLLISTSTASDATWYSADGTSTGAVGTDPDIVVTPASGPLTYSSNTTLSLPFAAAQYIVAADNTAGDYSDTITFTLSYTP
jgi:C-terminal processing protease CtpA/Prc